MQAGQRHRPRHECHGVQRVVNFLDGHGFLEKREGGFIGLFSASATNAGYIYSNSCASPLMASLRLAAVSLMPAHNEQMCVGMDGLGLGSRPKEFGHLENRLP